MKAWYLIFAAVRLKILSSIFRKEKNVISSRESRSREEGEKLPPEVLEPVYAVLLDHLQTLKILDCSQTFMGYGLEIGEEQSSKENPEIGALSFRIHFHNDGASKQK